MSNSEIIACVVCAGVGLTSLIISLSALGPSDHAEDAEQLLADALDEHEAPNELLLAGVSMESLLLSYQALAELPVRLVPADVELQLVRDHCWLLGPEQRPPKLAHGLQSTLLGSQGNLQLHELLRQDSSANSRLSERLRGAQVYYVKAAPSRSADPPAEAPAEQKTPCSRWRFGRSFCGPNDWNWVGSAEVNVGGRSERCIWAHPLAGFELHIVFPSYDRRAVLQGRYAFTDSAMADSSGSPITFRVLVDGEERIKRVLPNKSGWNPFVLPARAELDQPAELRFIITASHDGRRHFCFDADLHYQKK